MELTIEVILFLFSVALVAGFIDTLAGGGGLITIPSLLLCGIPPLQALGTNKFQSVMGTATATYMLHKAKAINWQQMKLPLLYAFAGSVLGTLAVQFIDKRALSFVIPVVLIIIATYFLLSPLFPAENSKITLPEKTYNKSIISLIGTYDGMFGPGTGSFFALAGVALRGKKLIDATIVAKPLNCATNCASLIVFLFSGHIVWIIGVSMMLGQFIGARLGACMLFKINKNVLRYLIVFMCIGMLIKSAL